MVFITPKYPPSSNVEARARNLHEKFKNLQQLQCGLLDKFNSEFPANWEGSEQILYESAVNAIEGET